MLTISIFKKGGICYKGGLFALIGKDVADHLLASCEMLLGAALIKAAADSALHS